MSYQWRKTFGATPEQYDQAPGLQVDWDMQLMGVEARVKKKMQDKADRA